MIINKRGRWSITLVGKMDHFATLPNCPRLRPGTEVVRVDNDKILLRSFSGTVMISGEFVSSELPALLPKLDGSRTIQELFESVNNNFRQEFEKLLVLMVEKSLLYDETSVGTRSSDSCLDEISSNEKAYWSLYGPPATDALERLRSSTVIVTNLGGVGVNIAQALAASGVGKLVLIDSHYLRRSDEVFGYSAENLGRPRVEVVAADLSRRKCTEVIPIVGSVDAVSDWVELVSTATLVVLASDNMSLAGYDRTNEACIRHGTSWVSARIDRSRGIIGPFVVPGQTACFTCLELRNRANAEYPEDHEALYRHWKKSGGCNDDWPIIAPIVHLVGSYVALDIQRVLAGNHLSAVLGRVLDIHLHTFEARFHDILKLPRCPACSRARERPLSRIWDIRPTVDAQGSDGNSNGSGPSRLQE